MSRAASPPRPAPRRARGFTLIEMLVAVFIAAVMFAIGYGAINQALKSRGTIRADQRKLLALQTAVRVMEQDFVQLAPRPIRSPEGQGWLPAIMTTGSSASSDSNGSISNSSGASGSGTSDTSGSGPPPLVTLTRDGWSNPIGVQRPELERVAYVFEKGTLIREHWNVLDPTLSQLPVKRNLLKHLRSVRFLYLNYTRRWVTQWPPTVVGAETGTYLRERPLAVKVVLDTKDFGKIVRIFEIPG